MYCTNKIIVKKAHPLHPYLDCLTKNAKNLYNTTQFYYRQIYTALMNENELHPLQKEVFAMLEAAIPKMNTIRDFHLPTKENPSVSYEFLEAFFKCTDHQDYRSLPAQVNQQVMRLVFKDWKSYFKGRKEYKKHPEKFLGKPQMPGYKKQEKILCTLTNQICQIKGSALRFPLTKETLELGLIAQKGKLQQVRVHPYGKDFLVELVFNEQVSEKAIVREKAAEPNTLVHEAKKIMSMDLGVNVLAAITDNTGLRPILVRGTLLISINQWYNKQMAFYTAALRNGKTPNEGPFTSKRIQNMTRKHNRRVEDFLHKASTQIVGIAVERKIDTIVIGHNPLWKQELGMRKKDNQNFFGIPFYTFISMVKYKAERLGIQVVIQEESYTSKASFLSDDPIPIYQKGNEDKHVFNGNRITRSIYKDKTTGIQWHADLNGSCNIGRKMFPDMFKGMDVKTLLQNPIVIKVKRKLSQTISVEV